MQKFLITASYTDEGVKGLLKEGGTSRKKTIEKLVTELGGKLEAFYFAFGDYDVYAILEVPDNITAAAVSLTINASGLVNLSGTILLTPADIDKASKKTVHYRPPGK
jgi:uncharacterized protein with GYD domain